MAKKLKTLEELADAMRMQQDGNNEGRKIVMDKDEFSFWEVSDEEYKNNIEKYILGDEDEHYQVSRIGF